MVSLTGRASPRRESAVGSVLFISDVLWSKDGRCLSEFTVSWTSETKEEVRVI